MSIDTKVMRIIKEMGDLPRGGKRTMSDHTIRYHNENEIRKAVKEALIKENILMDIKEITIDVVNSSDFSGGNRMYSTMHVKCRVRIVLKDMDSSDEEKYVAGSAALGDNFANASSAAVTYAIRDWMKVKFQITYPISEETEDIMDVPMVMPDDIAEECRLIISRNLSEVKKRAKEAGAKPKGGKWNVAHMSHEDLFRFAVMAMNESGSAQSEVMGSVVDKLEENA